MTDSVTYATNLSEIDLTFKLSMTLLYTDNVVLYLLSFS